LPTGDYVVRAYNAYVPVTSTTFRLQALNNDSAVVSVQLPQTSYNLGDTVRGIVTVLSGYGSVLSSNATVSYNVSFGNSSVANTSVSLSSSNGMGIISFSIPSKASSQSPVILFTVKNGNTTYIYS
jgi:hypothetical protein